MRFNLKQIPNILSVIRILLVFAFVYFVFLPEPYGERVAVLVFILAGATDVVDGFLARKYNWITNLGKLLDPFADKLMQCTVLVCLCLKEIIPLWFVIPFFVKEISTLLLGFFVIRRRNVVVVSRWYGKAAVCLFYLTVVISVMLQEKIVDNGILQLVLFLPAVIFALAAFFGYIKHYSVLRKEEMERGKIRDVIK
jgi:cardiolipin synthase